jgi:hypothetical protein
MVFVIFMSKLHYASDYASSDAVLTRTRAPAEKHEKRASWQLCLHTRQVRHYQQDDMHGMSWQ